MAAKEFIVGGVDNKWSTAGNWNPANKPTTNDTVTVNAAVAAMQIDEQTAIIASIDMTGAAANFILSGTGELRCTGNITYKASSTATMTHSGTVTVSGNSTFTSNGMTLGSPVTLATASVTLTLGDALNIAAKALTISRGTFSTSASNFAATCGVFGDGSVAAAVTLTLGTSTINCSNVSFAAATLTVTANTAAINITSTADIIANFGGKTWGGTTTVLMTGGKVLTLNGANTFGNFAISWTTASNASGLKFGADQVVSGTFTLAGSTTIVRPWVVSASSSTQRTITAATVTITGAVDFRDIKGAGDGSWNLSGIASGNKGGNSSITFRTPANYYLVGLTADKTYVDDCYSASDDGTPDGTSVFPLPQDTLIINNNTGDNTNKKWTTATNAFQTLSNVDASALTESLTFVFLNTDTNCYGNLILTGSGLSITSTGASIILDARPKNELSTTLDVNILPALGSGSIQIGVINVQTGTVRLLTNNLTHTGTFTLARGTFDLNGKALTTGTFSSSNSNTREIKDTAGGGKIVTTGVTGTIFDVATTTNLTVSNAPDIDIGDSTKTLTGNVTAAFGSKPCTFGDLAFKKHAGDYPYIVTGVGNTFGAVTQETPDAS